jgi:arsenate reductase-like glutaredoxin family protein
MAPDSRTALRLAQSSLLLLAMSASAQTPSPVGFMYTCISNGKVYTADRPPAECANVDMRELNRDGSVRRIIPRPLTVDEQRARALEAKKKIEDEERQLAQRRRDRSLLEAYATEAEIETARKKSLEGAEQIIKRSQERSLSLSQDKRRLDDEAEFYKKREQPDSLKRAFALNEQAVGAEQKIVAEARAEVDRINERFDAEKRRFRELVAQGARPVQRNPEPDILLDPRFKETARQ